MPPTQVPEREIRLLEKRLDNEGLLIAPGEAISTLRKARRSMKGVSDIIPGRLLTAQLNYLKVHPLLEQLQIFRHQVENGTLSDDQREDLVHNEKKYNDLVRTKPWQTIMATDLEQSRIKVVRYNPHNQPREELEYIMVQNGVCYQDKRRLSDIIDSFHYDSLLGGSVIVTVENANSHHPRKANPAGKDRRDKTILAVGRYLLGSDRRGEPVLTADIFTSGDYKAHKAETWADEGKGDLLAYGMTIHLYMAEQLGIGRLVYTDSALAQFARAAGVGGQYTFNRSGRHGNVHDSRKLGIIAVPSNSKGIWQSSLYGNGGRLPTLDYSPLSIEGLFWEFEAMRTSITRSLPPGKLPAGYEHSLRIGPRFEVMYALLRVMEDAFTHHPKFEQSKHLFNQTINLVKQHNQDFSRSYVK